MRNRLWMLFHLGTVAVLVLLTVANVVSWLRPYATNPDAADSAERVNLASLNSSGRAPAAVGSSNPANSKNPLKIAQVGCESNVRLRVFENVRQVRLQFDVCKEQVTGVMNSTNGFEATVFGTASALEPAEGTFTTPGKSGSTPKRAIASTEAKPKKTTRALAMISTDFISLAPGANQIKIVRAGREQVLTIERK